MAFKNEDYINAIKMIKATDINGCLTGSSLWCFDTDISTWDSDIDIFVYNMNSLINAVDTVRELGWNFANMGEKWKWTRLLTRDDKKQWLSTIKLDHFMYPQVNISFKPGQSNVTDVITAFDQTCVMHGYDIRRKIEVDMREMFTGDKWISILNPLYEQDADAYTVSQWLRQTNRVAKYASRGIDTSEVARGYLKLIDNVLATGQLFSSEKSTEFFEQTKKEFEPIREGLNQWLETTQ